jgi:hypothetical protein
VTGTVLGLHGEGQVIVIATHFATCHTRHGQGQGRLWQADGALPAGGSTWSA